MHILWHACFIIAGCLPNQPAVAVLIHLKAQSTKNRTTLFFWLIKLINRNCSLFCWRSNLQLFRFIEIRVFANSLFISKIKYTQKETIKMIYPRYIVVCCCFVYSHLFCIHNRTKSQNIINFLLTLLLAERMVHFLYFFLFSNFFFLIFCIF